MSKIEESIDVKVPVRVAYDQWTQFEEFPRFMNGVESVEQIDDTNLHWIAKIGGIRKEWDAEITQQEPDQRVAWKSTTGADNGGAVDFHRLDDQLTRITLTMDVAPQASSRRSATRLAFPRAWCPAISSGSRNTSRSVPPRPAVGVGPWSRPTPRGDWTRLRPPQSVG